MILRILTIIVLVFEVSQASAGSYDDLLTAIKLNDLVEAEALFAKGMDPDTTDPNANSLLMLAVREDHLDMARRLLDRKAKVGAKNRYGETALMLAAAKGNPEMVKLLVQRGAAINQTGWNPLIYAAWQGHEHVVKYLLEKGAEIDALAPNGTSALMMAARGGHLEVVRLLLWKVADPNIKSDAGARALTWALKAGNTDIVDLLRQAGAKD